MMSIAFVPVLYHDGSNPGTFRWLADTSLQPSNRRIADPNHELSRKKNPASPDNVYILRDLGTKVLPRWGEGLGESL